MAEILQQILNGLVVGAAYALIAVGLTVIFGLMDVVNFAHGEFYLLGAVCMYYLTMQFGVNFFLSIILAVALTMAVGLLIDRLLLQPLRGAPLLTTALAMIGLSIFIANLVLVTSGPVPKIISSPFASAPLQLGPVLLPKLRLFAGVVTLAVIVASHFALKCSSFGRDIRATFQDRHAAALVGIPVNKVYRYTFTIGSAFAALAGALLGSIFMVYPTMGILAVSKAFVIVIVGGLGSFPGAVSAGLLLGVVETLAAGYISSGYKDAIGWIVVVVVLLYQPLAHAWRVRKVRSA